MIRPYRSWREANSTHTLGTTRLDTIQIDIWLFRFSVLPLSCWGLIRLLRLCVFWILWYICKCRRLCRVCRFFWGVEVETKGVSGKSGHTGDDGKKRDRVNILPNQCKTDLISTNSWWLVNRIANISILASSCTRGLSCFVLSSSCMTINATTHLTSTGLLWKGTSEWPLTISYCETCSPHVFLRQVLSGNYRRRSTRYTTCLPQHDDYWPYWMIVIGRTLSLMTKVPGRSFAMSSMILYSISEEQVFTFGETLCGWFV